MFTKLKNKGYTIVELLVVISVMAIVGIGAIGAIQNQQRRTEFTQAVRDFESKVIDIARDVSTGYFPDTGQDIVCTASIGGGISINPMVDGVQGGSRECVFGGKIIGFNVDDQDGSMYVETLAARRTLRDTNLPEDIRDFENGDIAIVQELSDMRRIINGVRVSSVRHEGADYGAIGFLSSFSNRDRDVMTGVQFTGAPTTTVKAIDGTNASEGFQYNPTLVEQSGNPGNYIDIGSSPVSICLEHGTGGRQAEVFIGREGRTLTTDVQFDAECGD